MGDSDISIVSKIIFFLSSLSFLSLLISGATGFIFITVQSLAWFTGGTIAVAGACVVATGLPCAVAIVIYGAITSILTYFNISASFTWLGSLILTPLSIILILFIAKLARGN